MALSLKDRVKELTTTTGTGTLTLVSAPTGFRRFNSVLSNGDTTYYCIESGAQWEVGLGVYSANTLARTTVLASSNANALINITASRSFVFIVYPADKATYKDGSNRTVIGSAGLIFSDNSIQTTAATSPDLSAYAPLVSPAFTGVPTAPTATGGTNTTQIATTAFVASAVGGIDLSPYLTAATAASTYVALAGSYANPTWITELAWGKLTSIPSTFTPSSHTHGNITNAGAIGSTSGLPIITTTGGALTTGAFGTTSGTFAEGNDSRITGALSVATAASTYLPLAGGTLTGDLKFTDATYDIGKSGATRPRDAFFSRNLTVGTRVIVSGYGDGTSPAFEFGGGSSGMHYITAGIAFKAYGDANAAGILNSGFHLAAGRNLSWSSHSSLDYSAIDLILTRDAADTLHQRRSTNAQTFRIANTWTSTTSFETFQIKANAGAAYQVGSAVGSAGGSNRAIDFGRWNAAGAWTSLLTWDSSDALTSTRSFQVSGELNMIRCQNSGFGSEQDGSGLIIYSNGWQVWPSRTGFNSRTGQNANSSRTGFIHSTTHTNAAFNSFFDWRVAAPAALNTTSIMRLAFDGSFVLSQPASEPGWGVSPTILTVIGGAHTALPATVETTDVNFNLARTVQFATGSLTTQRTFRIQAPTYSFVGASTITTASTLSISGPPVAGTNATITNAYALNVESGASFFGGKITAPATGQASTGGIGNGNNGVDFYNGVLFYLNISGSATYPVWCTVSASVPRLKLASNCLLAWGDNPDVSSAAGHDLGLGRDSAGILAQRRDTNAQVLRVYNTYTSSTSGEWGEFNWQTTANVLRIGTNKGSAGGSARDVAIVHGGTVVANFLSDRFYLGPITDGTATGGNARGQYAVDLQLSRSSASQVASGAYAVCIGSNNSATHTYGVAIGTSNTVQFNAALALGIGCVGNGANSSAIGSNSSTQGGDDGSVAIGSGASVVGNGFAFGYYSKAGAVDYGLAFASGRFAAAGDAQSVKYHARAVTTNATPATLYSGSGTSSKKLFITSGKILFADIKIAGIKSDGSAAACYKRKVAIKNVGGTTSLVGTVETIGTDIEDNVLTDVSITADNTNDALDIVVTGIAGETWRWVAVVEGLEIAYGT